jgi:hypothetical protein
MLHYNKFKKLNVSYIQETEYDEILILEFEPVKLR